MKIFKLKYLMLSLVATGLVSCVKDDIIQSADKEAVTELNSFVFQEEINNYVIDGKVTYDRSEIANAAKEAWNVHFDYPHSKVVISTTPAKFEEYKNSNLEFKTALIEDDKASTHVTNKAVAVGIHNGKYDAINYDSNLVFHFQNTTDKYHYIFVRAANTNINSQVSTHRISNDGTLSTANLNLNSAGMFTTNSTKGFLKNNSNSQSRTITFYKYIDYIGPNLSVTVGSNKSKRIDSVVSSTTWYGGISSYK